MRDKPLANLTLDDEDSSFLIYNLFNDILEQYKNETSQYSLGVKKISNNNVEIFLIILIVAAAIFFILLIMIMIFQI